MLIVSESGYKSQEEEDSVNNKLSEIILSSTNMVNTALFCTLNLQRFYIDINADYKQTSVTF